MSNVAKLEYRVVLNNGIDTLVTRFDDFSVQSRQISPWTSEVNS